MITTQTVLLNQTTRKIPTVVHAVQNDSGRRLKMIISDETIPSESTAVLSICRSDGTHYDIENCVIDTSDNSVTATDISQALTCPGATRCQLKISGIVSTYTFIIDVERDSAGIVSPQQGISLTEAIRQAQIYAERAEAAASVAGISDDVKRALLACFEKVAWINDDGQNYYNDLENSLYPRYTVTYNLTNVFSSNNSTSATDSYSTTLSIASGYITEIEVIMGGIDITNSVFTPNA